jgi:hypothetical protein
MKDDEVREGMKKLLREMGRKGGFASAARLTPRQRSARARKARRAQLRRMKGGAGDERNY